MHHQMLTTLLAMSVVVTVAGRARHIICEICQFQPPPTLLDVSFDDVIYRMLLVKDLLFCCLELMMLFFEQLVRRYS